LRREAIRATDAEHHIASVLGPGFQKFRQLLTRHRAPVDLQRHDEAARRQRRQHALAFPGDCLLRSARRALAERDFLQLQPIFAGEPPGVFLEATIDPVGQARAGGDEQQTQARLETLAASRRAALTSHRLSRR
jgi:hypothetical protein